MHFEFLRWPELLFPTVKDPTDNLLIHYTSLVWARHRAWRVERDLLLGNRDRIPRKGRDSPPGRGRDRPPGRGRDRLPRRGMDRPLGGWVETDFMILCTVLLHDC
jgi:hypothetical protein